MKWATESGNGKTRRPLQFGLRDLLIASTVACSAMALGLSGDKGAGLYLSGTVLVAIGLALAFRHGNTVAPDVAVVGAIWIAAVAVIPLLFWVRESLHLCSIRSPTEAARGKAVWLVSIGVFAGLPALAGVLRARLSKYTLGVTGFLVLASTMTVFDGGWDDAGVAILLWTGAELAFAAASTLLAQFQARRWFRLAAMSLLLAFGSLMVTVATWAPLYLE